MTGQSNAFHSRCEYCGVAVGRADGNGRTGYRYADGRAICARCHTTAIKTAEQLSAVWRQVARTFKRLGLAVDWEHLPVQMLDKSILQREAAGPVNVVGVAHSLLTTFTVSSRISLLYGMPMAIAAQTLGHEAGHVWCREQGVSFHPAECEEGFANVLACLVLQNILGADARRAIEGLFADPDPIYGDRFREQWALLQQLGWEPYRERVRTANRAPWCNGWFDGRLTAVPAPSSCVFQGFRQCR